MLIELIEKYKNILFNSREYIICNQLLKKIETFILACNSDDVKLEFEEISNLSKEEISMFSSPECERIVSSLKVISNKKGWRIETVVKLIERLKQDILENKMQELKKQIDSLGLQDKMDAMSNFDIENLKLDLFRTFWGEKVIYAWLFYIHQFV